MTKAEIENDEVEGPEEDEGLEDAPDAVESTEAADADPTADASGTVGDDENGRGESAEPVEEEIGRLRAEIEELNDRHLRLAAEFNNYRRRSEQARLESWSRAQADLVTSFLDVLDDLHRVAELDLSNATLETIMEGIDLVERKFMRVLEEAGVQVIDPAGHAFDPERMEAMMRVPTDSEELDDHVAQVFAKGYTLDGILVRPARVSVHKVG